MRSQIAQKMWDETPKETKIFATKYADLVVCINEILERKNINNSNLAELLDKSPSEIHKWLRGAHNFTLKSICKLEAELGETLLEVPSKHKLTLFTKQKGKPVIKAYSVLPYNGHQHYNVWQKENIETQPIPTEKAKCYA